MRVLLWQQALRAFVFIGWFGAAQAQTNDADPMQSISPAPPPRMEFSDQSVFTPNTEGFEPMIGVWRGRWSGTLDSFVAFHTFKDGSVSMYHSWGTNLLVPQSGYIEVEAEVTPKGVEYRFNTSYWLAFRYDADQNVIVGEYHSLDRPTSIGYFDLVEGID